MSTYIETLKKSSGDYIAPRTKIAAVEGLQAALDLKATAADVDAIEEKIPSAATSSNQLADKEFVNSSISTETAHYISNNGEPFTSVEQLRAYTGTVTNNDYAFVSGTDETGNAYYDRYKATVSGTTVTWAKEFRLNNSSFTAVQWSAINSGITSTLRSSYDTHLANTSNPHSVTATQVGLGNVNNTSDANKPISTATQTALDAKQNTLTFDNTPTAGSTNPVTSGGVYTALADKVNTTENSLTTESKLVVGAINEVNSGKVDKVSGKGLSTNDYDATEKQKVTDAYADKHTHSNKSVLDGIDSSDVSSWDAKAEVVKQTSISLSITSPAWELVTGETDVYEHSITTISGVTSNTKVDLQPSASIVKQLIDDDVSALYVLNNSGTLKAIAVGSAPTAALNDIQVTYYEVN